MAENAKEASESEYSSLKDFSLGVDVRDGSFSFCFWVYLMKPTSLPATIIRQVHSDATDDAPFLVLTEEKKLMLLPVCFLHKEAPDTSSSSAGADVPYASSEKELPLEKWIHVGCEVSTDFVRLHIDGQDAGQKLLTSLFDKVSDSNYLRRLTLVSSNGDSKGVQGYVHNVRVMPQIFSIKDHFVEDPPLHLSIDNSSASEIEEDKDGVWSIVGGKASCRRNFSVDIVLLDALGQPPNKEIEVIASLLYADTGAPVENTGDEEAPLLTTYDGIEFASYDRPCKVLHGRASFRLKISQLSSKCDNRLFRIRFDIPKIGSYPFLEAFSHPIRCISRNRNTRPSTIVWKKLGPGSHPLNGPGSDDGSVEPHHNIVREAKPSPSSKRIRLGQEKISSTNRNDSTLDRSDEECNSRAQTANREEEDDSPSDSESNEARNSSFSSLSSSKYPTSDLTIFRYCLGGLSERSLLLKEIVNSVSNEELLEFAHQVSLFSGCSHHRQQIIIARRLIEEGTRVWNVISQNNQHVHWDNAVFEIEEQFMRIACCNTRSLMQEDLEILRKIAGCNEYLTQESFERMWCWLYPVAFTISREWINSLWRSTPLKWIEGFITKEEAESSLQGPRGLQEPGTFILRFPTSRSWPHPDAGSLVATYVGSDFTLHHKLLFLDYMYSSNALDMNMKPLQEMLLAEPELSKLGRIMRSH